MKVIPLSLAEVLQIEPDVFPDERGFLYETFQEQRYGEMGVPGPFVLDALSFSKGGTVRGLHFQNPHPQAKLVYVASGEISDVAVDVRRESPSFGEWVGIHLSSENKLQLYIPVGFAHGFQVLSESAVVVYKLAGVYLPGAGVTVRWDDPDIAIDWRAGAIKLSPRDASAPLLKDIEPNRLLPFPGENL